jgi:ferredoxin
MRDAPASQHAAARDTSRRCRTCSRRRPLRKGVEREHQLLQCRAAAHWRSHARSRQLHAPAMLISVAASSYVCRSPGGTRQGAQLSPTSSTATPAAQQAPHGAAAARSAPNVIVPNARRDTRRSLSPSCAVCSAHVRTLVRVQPRRRSLPMQTRSLHASSLRETQPNASGNRVYAPSSSRTGSRRCRRAPAAAAVRPESSATSQCMTANLCAQHCPEGVLFRERRSRADSKCRTASYGVAIASATLVEL